MQLSLDNIRALAKLERDMDTGAQPFVFYSGSRWAFPRKVLSHLGVESGQTVTHPILLEIMRANLLYISREIEQQEG